MGKARLIYIRLEQRKKAELSCLSDYGGCVSYGQAPFAKNPFFFSWRLPPHEPSLLPAGVNPYTQSFYQTMRKFSITFFGQRPAFDAPPGGSQKEVASRAKRVLFALVGEICPKAPLNDFCKIGCAPAELSSPAACQEIAAICEYVIDTFSISGYT